MRTLSVVLLALGCGSDARRVKPEQQGRKSIIQEPHSMSEVSPPPELRSETGTERLGGTKQNGPREPSRLKALGAFGLAAGARMHPGAAVNGSRSVGGAYLNHSGRSWRSRSESPDLERTIDGEENLFPGLLASDADDNDATHHNDAASLEPAPSQEHIDLPADYASLLDDIDELDPAMIQQKSPLTILSATKDIYELASGELLFLAKSDAGPLEELVLELVALQAILRMEITVALQVPVLVTHPVTDMRVLGVVQPQVPGTFVDIAKDPDAADKLISVVKSDPEAAFNLNSDIGMIIERAVFGLAISGLKGVVQPDGHFVVVGAKGLGSLKSGKFVGSVEGAADEMHATAKKWFKVLQETDSIIYESRAGGKSDESTAQTWLQYFGFSNLF